MKRLISIILLITFAIIALTSNNIAFACSDDSECQGLTNPHATICNRGQCVECTDDSSCTSNNTLNNDGYIVCVNGTCNQSNACDPQCEQGQFCILNNGKSECVSCRYDSDCPNLQRCNLATHTCYSDACACGENCPQSCQQDENGNPIFPNINGSGSTNSGSSSD